MAKTFFSIWLIALLGCNNDATVTSTDQDRTEVRDSTSAHTMPNRSFDSIPYHETDSSKNINRK